MSLKALLEFAIQIESFRNIDLFHQGLYHLRFRIYQENNDTKIFAHPYNIIESAPNPRKKSNDNHNWIPSHLLDKYSAYVTRTFLIRFCEEEVDINEICHFRTEIDAYPALDDYNTMFFECELLFSDIANMNSLKKSEAYDITSFKSISVFKSRLNNVFKGIHEYVPVIFDEQHFCLVNVSFHSLLFDFRFRTSPLESKRIESLDIQNEEKLKAMNNVVGSATNNPNNNTNPQTAPTQIKPPTKEELLKLYPPKTFTEFLDRVSEKFDKNLIDNFYSVYVKALRNSYESLVKHYKAMLARCLVDKNKKDLPPLLLDDPMDLPEPYYITNYGNKELSKGPIDDLEITKSTNSKNPTLKKYLNIPRGQMRNSKYQPTLAQVNKKPHFKKALVDIKSKFPKVSEVFNLFEVEDQEKLAISILKEVNDIAGLMFTILLKYVEIIKTSPLRMLLVLKDQFNEKIRERWGESIFRNKIKTTELSSFIESKTGVQHKNIAKSMRKKEYYQNLDPLNIEDLSMFPKADIHPIVFEDIYVYDDRTSMEPKKKHEINLDKEEKNPNISNVHLFVLVHGFQGNSFDMRLFKNNLSIVYPDGLYLCSSSNEENTEGDIEDMGKNLAREVRSYINEWCPNNTLGRLSFIGHSLGGIIIRAALPHLHEFSSKMYTFLTLSSPHLGYVYNSSTLIDAGMWVLKRWRKSLSLQQLSFSDAKQMEDSFLYKLSRAPGLGWFKNIVLVSSYQDQYAPFESARIQQCKKALNDAGKGAKYQRMAENLLSNLRTDRVHRIDVNFQIKSKSFDNFIGRAAHIQFLESQALMRMMVYTFDNLFK